MSRRGWALFALMSVIWGVPYLLIRVAVADIPPAAVVLVRVGLGALVLLPICAIRGLRTTLAPVFGRWRPLLAYTVVELGIPWLLLTHAETQLSSSLTGILVAATALVMAVITWAIGSADRLDMRRVVGLALGFAGVVVLLGLDLGDIAWIAVIEVGVVTVGYAAGPLILARYLSDLPAIGVVTASVAITAVAYVPIVLFGPAVHWGRLGTSGWLSLVGLAVICTAVAFVTFFALIAEAGPTRASFITYINPAVALLLGVVVLSEQVTLGMAIGFPLILLGCWLGTARRRAVNTDLPATGIAEVTIGAAAAIVEVDVGAARAVTVDSPSVTESAVTRVKS